MTRARGPAADRAPGASERARTSADTGPPDSPDPGGAEEGGGSVSALVRARALAPGAWSAAGSRLRAMTILLVGAGRR